MKAMYEGTLPVALGNLPNLLHGSTVKRGLLDGPKNLDSHSNLGNLYVL